MAKANQNDHRKQAIDRAHKLSTAGNTMGYMKSIRNAGYTTTPRINRAFGQLLSQNRVSFRLCPESNYWRAKPREEANGVQTKPRDEANSALITYDSGADGHYISKEDRKKAQMPILRASTKQVRVANGNTSTAKHVTNLPFPQLSAKAT